MSNLQRNKKQKTRSQNRRNDKNSSSSMPKDIAHHGGTGCSSTNYDDIRSNDISWYNKAGFLYSEATRVPFDAIAGAPRSYEHSIAGLDPRHTTVEGAALTDVNGIAVPGIMRIDYHPTIGWSDGVNAPVNRAFTTLYGDIASKTTGAMQFQQADLAMLVTSLSSISSIIGNLKRLLEIATLYSPMNYYYPVDLLQALTGSSVNAMDIIYNRDVYRARVNDLIFQFNQLRVPHFVEIYKRQYSLAHNIYADEDSVQAQIYVFRALGYYKYLDTEAKLKYVEISDFSFDGLVKCAQDALNAWRGSSDLPLISGALIRAYPDNQFITLDTLNIDDKTIPVYDRNMLWQINNLRTVKVDVSSLDISQDVVNNFIISRPLGELATNLDKATFWRSWVYLNSYDFNESPEFIMESTRLIPNILPELYDETHIALDNSPTELVNSFTIFHRYTDTSGISVLSAEIMFTNMLHDAVQMHRLANLSRWHNAPRVDVWSMTTEGYDFVGTFGDLGDYTYLYPHQLISLNEAALQSLYWVDSMNLKI